MKTKWKTWAGNGAAEIWETEMSEHFHLDKKKKKEKKEKEGRDTNLFF